MGVMRLDSVGTPTHKIKRILGQMAVIATDRTRGSFGEIRRTRLVDQEHVVEARRAIAVSWRLDFDEAYQLEVGKLLKPRHVCFGRISLETSHCQNALMQGGRGQVDRLWNGRTS
jgi:hypothetical protein